jgi:hypothetical protein
MPITFKVRKNPDWYRDRRTNKAESRYEVAMYDGRELAAITGYSSSSREEAQVRAAEMQADEDAGLTINGISADDWHAIENGLASALIAYEDSLPALVAEFGAQEAKARHPWRITQTGGHA